MARSIVVHLPHPDDASYTWCNVVMTKRTVLCGPNGPTPSQQLCATCAARRREVAQPIRTPAAQKREAAEPGHTSAVRRRKKVAPTPEPLSRVIDRAPDSVARPAVVQAAKTSKRNCSTVAREMILNGATNDEVWAVISVEFRLSADKRGYPNWYRSKLRRDGLLPE